MTTMASGRRRWSSSRVSSASRTRRRGAGVDSGKTPPGCEHHGERPRVMSRQRYHGGRRGHAGATLYDSPARHLMLFFFELLLFVLVMLTLALGEFVSRGLALGVWLTALATSVGGYFLALGALRPLLSGAPPGG